MLDGSHVNNAGFIASQLLLKDGKITCYGVSDTGEQKLSYELMLKSGARARLRAYPLMPSPVPRRT